MVHLSFQELSHLFKTCENAEGKFTGISTDTRTLQPGNLFVALRGENFDGHTFCEEALRKGAAGLVVDHAVSASVPVFLVKDTLVALGEIARLWKSKFKVKTIALTGSHGKTTLKNMLRSVMEVAFGKDAVLASSGNFNNRIGLPLNLFRLKAVHQILVLEMGMSELGEIHFLSEIAEPDVAIVHNIGYSHIGKLHNDLSCVARAKSEIFQGLSQEGVAVLNADDEFFSFLKTQAGQHRILTYAVKTSADFTPENIQASEMGTEFFCEGHKIVLTQPGQHHVMNALAVIAASRAIGIGWSEIAQGLKQFTPEKQRQEIKPGFAGSTLIDDTYNASLHSSKAALEVLAKKSGKKFFVFGDMFELGDFSKKFHAEVGSYAKSSGVDRLFAVGSDSAATVEAFGAGAEFYPSKEALIAAIRPLLDAHTTVLVKGSRGMKMEEVVEALQG